jgi:hypothetical protein
MSSKHRDVECSTSQTPDPSGLRMQWGGAGYHSKPAEVPPMAPNLPLSGAARRKLKEQRSLDRSDGYWELNTNRA